MSATQVRFETWKTIEIGTGLRTPEHFREAVKEANESEAIRARKMAIRLSINAKEVLLRPAFSFAEEYRLVDLVKVSHRQFGFTRKAPRIEIYTRAEEFGLQKCPAEVGPQLRLQYLFQPQKERLAIGMEPIRGEHTDRTGEARPGGYLDLFLVDHDASSLWLRAGPGNPGGFWDDEFQWIFMNPPRPWIPAIVG
jgi:hypothetical protein